MGKSLEVGGQRTFVPPFELREEMARLFDLDVKSSAALRHRGECILQAGNDGKGDKGGDRET